MGDVEAHTILRISFALFSATCSFMNMFCYIKFKEIRCMQTYLIAMAGFCNFLRSLVNTAFQALTHASGPPDYVPCLFQASCALFLFFAFFSWTSCLTFDQLFLHFKKRAPGSDDVMKSRYCWIGWGFPSLWIMVIWGIDLTNQKTPVLGNETLGRCSLFVAGQDSNPSFTLQTISIIITYVPCMLCAIFSVICFSSISISRGIRRRAKPIGHYSAKNSNKNSKNRKLFSFKSPKKKSPPSGGAEIDPAASPPPTSRPASGILKKTFSLKIKNDELQEGLMETGSLPQESFISAFGNGKVLGSLSTPPPNQNQNQNYSETPRSTPPLTPHHNQQQDLWKGSRGVVENFFPIAAKQTTMAQTPGNVVLPPDLQAHLSESDSLGLSADTPQQIQEAIANFDKIKEARKYYYFLISICLDGLFVFVEFSFGMFEILKSEKNGYSFLLAVSCITHIYGILNFLFFAWNERIFVPRTTDEILDNPTCLEFLSRFCEKILCNENITFWVELQIFSKLSKNKNFAEFPPNYLKSTAMSIFQKYFLPTSSLQLDLTDEVRIDITTKILQGNFQNKIFEKAEDAIHDKIKHEILPKFFESSDFEEMIQYFKKKYEGRGKRVIFVLISRIFASCQRRRRL